MSLNKVVTSVNALTNNVVLPDSNNVVCIDTSNNRIGVKTSNPTNEIDVSGTIKTKILYIDQTSNQNYDINYDNSFLIFEKGLFVKNDLSCNGQITASSLDISSLIVDNDISCNTILCPNISCNILTANIVNDDISFIANVDISGTVSIDGSLNVNDLLVQTLVGSSDDRLKHNETHINNGLEIIRQLQPQVYQKTKNFKDPEFSGVLNENYIVEAGLIAQDILTLNDLSFTVIPGNETKPYYLNYNNIFVYGLAALKELDNSVSNNITNIIDLSNLIHSSSFNNNSNNVNYNNLDSIINNQNLLIQSLNNKVNNLEQKILNLENNL